MENNNKHYHILLMVNKDIYKRLGNYNQEKSNLAILIQQAWCSTINTDYPKNRYFVHFPDNPIYWLDANSLEIKNQISALNERCLYLAKYHTKHYGDGEQPVIFYNKGISSEEEISLFHYRYPFCL